MVIFPVAPDQTIAQMWLSGARGGACILRTQCEFTMSALMKLNLELDLVCDIEKDHDNS